MWVGSDYIRSVLDMFAYERDENDVLVIGAGLPADWVTSGEGVSVSGLRTTFGTLSFRMRGNEGEVRVMVEALQRAPAGGVVVRSPFDRPIREAAVNGRAATIVEATEVRIARVPATVVLRY